MKYAVVIGAVCLVALAVLGGLALMGRIGTDRPVTVVNPPPRAELPSGLFLSSEPAGAVSVEEAKGTAKVGDTVTVRGRVGGSMEPFVEGRAVFTLVGRGIPACTDIPGHNCDTPWDYCHEPVEEVAAHSATVQVVDDAGAVLRTTVKGRQGIKELSELVVVGRVSQTVGDTLVVNATGVYVASNQ